MTAEKVIPVTPEKPEKQEEMSWEPTTEPPVTPEKQEEEVLLWLCKADSGLSAMIGILAAISSHPGLVARCKILSYTCSCPIALRL